MKKTLATATVIIGATAAFGGIVPASSAAPAVHTVSCKNWLPKGHAELIANRHGMCWAGKGTKSVTIKKATGINSGNRSGYVVTGNGTKFTFNPKMCVSFQGKSWTIKKIHFN